MKTIKLPIKMSHEDKLYLHDIQRQQNNVIRFAFNRFNEEGKTRNEIYDLCNNLNHIELLDSWFINCAVVKGKEIYDSKLEIEANNKEYNKEHNPKNPKKERITVIFGGKKNFYKRLNNKITKEEFIQNRQVPLQCIGEAPQKGNRKFDVDSHNNRIYFYPNKNKEIAIFLPKCLHKNIMDQIIYLMQVMNNKAAPVSFEVTDSFICIKFDEALLAEEAYKKVQHRDNPTKVQYTFYHAIKNRALAIDRNPHEIGVSIVQADKDGNLSILYKELIDLKYLYFDKQHPVPMNQESHLKSTVDEGNKSTHEIIEICKYIYDLAKHWHCEKLGCEDLSQMQDNYGNKKTNTKNINDWKKNLVFKKLKMLCNSQQLIKFVDVNPAYTSFIGNMIYDFHDSINASIEIARRAISMEAGNKGKFYATKGSFYPPLSMIKDHWKKYLIGNKNDWRSFFSLIKTLDLRYRVLADLKDLAFFRFRNINSHIHLYKFI